MTREQLSYYVFVELGRVDTLTDSGEKTTAMLKLRAYVAGAIDGMKAVESAPGWAASIISAVEADREGVVSPRTSYDTSVVEIRAHDGKTRSVHVPIYNYDINRLKEAGLLLETGSAIDRYLIRAVEFKSVK